ncbi:MAG: CoB--CoM heterodisulfide reductase iron-sulfur subunit B family protein [Promethearchaeota archaeon]
MNDEFALFLGCTIPIKNQAFERASRLVLDDIGIKLHEMEGAGCCPNPVAIQSLNSMTWMSLAARNLAIAEEMELDVLTLCAGCFETLREVNQILKHNEKYKKQVQEILGKAGVEYKGSIEVHHVAGLLSDKDVLERIGTLANRSLDLNVASHYGCHLIRPSSHLKFDDPERPEVIDKVLKKLGFKNMDFSNKFECCGYCARLHPEIGQTLSERKMKELTQLKADCMVAVCPACANQYSNTQRLHNRKKKEEAPLNIPVLYLTELMALCFGYTPEELNLKSKMIKPTALIQKLSMQA